MRYALEPDGDIPRRVLLYGAADGDSVCTPASPPLYFCLLVVSGIPPVIDFGWMMTTGITLALVLDFILVPAMIWSGRGQAPSAFRYGLAAHQKFARVVDGGHGHSGGEHR